MITNKEAAEIMKVFKTVADYESKGKIREAIQEIQKAIKINPRDGNVFNRLGDLHIKNNRMPDAIEAYKRGIEAYRQDNFYRNALALCKKVLKYDPGNNDIYPIIARILIDLDEKSDALIYLFEYIERQKKNGNQREILQTADYIKTMNMNDPKVTERLNAIYREIGRNDLVEKMGKAEKDESPPEPRRMEPEPVVKEIELGKSSVTVQKPTPKMRDEVVDLSPEKNRLKEELTVLDDSIKTIQGTVTELRKAIRVDEVVIALDKSITVLSEQQRKAILALQQSLSLNIDNLMKNVKELSQGADKSAKNVEHLFGNLSSALASLSKNQAFLTQAITEKLTAIGDRYDSITKEGLMEMKGLLGTYQDSTMSMCNSLEKTKECNMNLLSSFNEVRTIMLTINDSLLKSALIQESNKRQQRKMFLFIIIALGAISILSLLSLIF